MRQKLAIPVLVLLSTIWFGASPGVTPLHAGEYKLVKDMCGNEAEAPVNPNWDMKKEMQEFYAEVYGKTVTDTDAERILRNLPPL